MPSLFDVLGYAGNLLDLPGSSVRDLLSGNNPFDQWATPFSSDNRVSGRDVLRPFLGENEETGMSGWLQNPMEGVKDVAGFGLEMVADPLNFVSLSPLWRALKGRKAVKGANAAEMAASKGRYGYVNPKVLAGEAAPEAMQQAGPKLLGYTPAPENPMFPGRELMYHGGHDMSASATAQHPYGIFDLGRLKTGEGNNMFGPGAYKADSESTSAFYRNMVQSDMNSKATQTPMYQLRSVIDDFTDNMNEPVDVDQLRKFFQDEADNPIMAKAGELFDILDRSEYFGADKNDLFFWEEMQNAMLSKKDLEEYIGRYEPGALEALSRYTTDRYGGKARLYGFDAPAGTKDRFLKWENPLGEQPQAVQDLVGDPRGLFTPEQLGLIDQAKVANADWIAATDRVHQMMSDEWLKNNERVGGTLKEKSKYLGSLRKQAAADSAAAQQRYMDLKRNLLDQKIPYDVATGKYQDLNDIDGETIADLLMGTQPSDATLADTMGMKAAGIPGVKNLAGSTSGQTYNYAIWDQDLLNQMRVRTIDGERVPINPMLGPTTQIEKTVIPQIADSPLTEVVNPMSTQPLPGLAKPAMQGAAYQALARFNTYGGSL